MFMDWRSSVLPKFWTCDVKVRMHALPDCVPALFCIRFRDKVNDIFKNDYKGLGGRVSA